MRGYTSLTKQVVWIVRQGQAEQGIVCTVYRQNYPGKHALRCMIRYQKLYRLVQPYANGAWQLDLTPEGEHNAQQEPTRDVTASN